MFGYKIEITMSDCFAEELRYFNIYQTIPTLPELVWHISKVKTMRQLPSESVLSNKN